MEEFLAKISDLLEVDGVTPDLRFRDLDDWNSLKGFSVLVMLEQDYGREMSVDEFLKCDTVLDLAKFAGVS